MAPCSASAWRSSDSASALQRALVRERVADRVLERGRLGVDEEVRDARLGRRDVGGEVVRVRGREQDHGRVRVGVEDRLGAGEVGDDVGVVAVVEHGGARPLERRDAVDLVVAAIAAERRVQPLVARVVEQYVLSR